MEPQDRDVDFSVFSRTLLTQALPVPFVLTLAILVLTASDRLMAGIIGATFVVLNNVLNFAIEKSVKAGRYPAFLLGPVRSILSIVFLPPLVWMGEGTFPRWIVAIPLIWALCFFFRGLRFFVPSA